MAFTHGKKIKVFIDKYEFTSYFREFSAPSAVDTADASTFGMDSKAFLVGEDSGTISLNGLFDSTALVSTDVFFAAVIGGDTKSIVIVGVQGHALGGRAVMCKADTSSYNIPSSKGDVVKAEAQFIASDGVQSGVFLSSGSSVTATGVGTGVDNGAASANGGVAYLSVPVDTRDGTVIVKVQHSADNSTFVDLVTFTTVVAATPTSERIVVAAGTAVSRYLRVSYTVAGTTGAATPVVAFARR